MMSFLLCVAFLIEIAIVSYIEYTVWKTVYTPLFFLLAPYLMVLVITVLISGRWGFVEFYYPSMIVWMVGVILFFIPSICLGISVYRNVENDAGNFYRCEMDDRIFTILAYMLAVLFLGKFYLTLKGSGYIPGSEDFGDALCGHGIWAHIRQFCIAILVYLIYSIDKNHKRYIFPIVVFLFISVMYQVKGWLIIAVASGMFMRIYDGKTQLRFSLIIKTVLAGFLLFQVIYTLSWVVAGKSEFGWTVFQYIALHFMHYFTSGVLGLSIDMERGMPDQQTWEVLFTPFVNIFHQFTDGKIMEPTNPYFFNSGINETNVRTFFGTIYISTNWAQFISITCITSFILYSLRLLLGFVNDIKMLAIYCFLCALISMGWFEYYFFHLEIIELPVWFFLVSKICIKR